MRLALVLCAVLVAGCGNDGQTQEAGARQLLEASQQRQPELKATTFREMSAHLHAQDDHFAPPLVPPSSPPAPARNAQSAPLPSWWYDTLDVRTFETMQTSMDRTLAKMPPEVAVLYDDAVKYLLIQVTTDPEIRMRASAGGEPSEQQILGAMHRILHGKTPLQLVEEAEALALQIRSEEPPAGY